MSAYNVNHADLAPNFTGLLFGITNTVANAPGFLAPEMVGAFTKDESTITTWSGVWYVTSAIYVIGRVRNSVHHISVLHKLKLFIEIFYILAQK